MVLLGRKTQHTAAGFFPALAALCSASRRAARVLPILAAALLAACTAAPDFRPIALPRPAPEQPMQEATKREHQRIVGSYGGTYDDPQLEQLVTAVVNNLVAASERRQGCSRPQ